MDRAGDGEYLASGFGGQPCGNQRTATRRGLDHQATQAKPGDKTVAAGKIGRQRRGAEREFAEDHAIVHNRAGQRLVARRIQTVGAGADDGHGAGRRAEPAAMSGGVDAQRQSADHGQPGLTQGCREGLGITFALRCGIPAADDGQHRPRQQFDVPAHIQQQRWIIGGQ